MLADEATTVMDAYQTAFSARDTDAADFHQVGMAALHQAYGDLVRLACQELRMEAAAARVDRGLRADHA